MWVQLTRMSEDAKIQAKQDNSSCLESSSLLECAKPKRYKNISKSLTIASLALFSSPSFAGDTVQENSGSELVNNITENEKEKSAESFGGKQLEVTKIDMALLYYQEPNRVTAAEGIVNLQASYGDKSVLDGKLLLDTLSGASPNGAVPQLQQQTFTRPSGNGVYHAVNGDTPLDDTFKDTRLQINGSWVETLSSTDKVNFGFHLSREYDYTSLGLNTGAEHSFNRGNSSVNTALGYYYDIVDPVGGRPVAWAPMLYREDFSSQVEFEDEFDKTRQESSAEKQTLDISFGFTQLLNRYWLVQGNYSVSYLNGYMTDPYKIISLVDDTGTAQGYRYEHRPDSRLKNSVYLLTKGALDTGVVDFSYRYSLDDWGIKSHTFETHYRYQFTSTFYGQLHLRYYRQSAADFYHTFLLDTAKEPVYGSADSRLGELDTYTFGVKFGHKLPDGFNISYRLELYQHKPLDNGAERVGQLAELALFEQVDAVIAQVGFTF